MKDNSKQLTGYFKIWEKGFMSSFMEGVEKLLIKEKKILK